MSRFTRDQTTRTAVVTGATSGIGRETVLALVRDGWQVIAVSRRDDRLAALKASCDHAIDTMRADLSLVRDNLRVARSIGASGVSVDALILNVGAVFPAWGRTSEGLEQTFALNHVGPYALSTRLQSRLRDTAGARVVVVSSQVHAGSLDFDNLQGELAYDGMEAYRRSKLCNLLFAFEASRRWSSDAVTVNALHPGVVDTGLLVDYAAAQDLAEGRSRPSLRRMARRLLGGAVRTSAQRYPGTITPDAGARTSVFLATDPSVEGETGRYYVDCRTAAVRPCAEDARLAGELWARTEAIVSEHEVDK